MTNVFTALDAQSEISALAFVASHEGAEVFTPTADDLTPAPRGVNVAKLVLHNLSVPFAKRISRAALATRVECARARGDVLALWATIHAECEPERAAIRAREDFDCDKGEAKAARATVKAAKVAKRDAAKLAKQAQEAREFNAAAKAEIRELRNGAKA